ncbi:MAG: DUF4282 domain-containing protein [Opitutales bacterium]|jgi:glycerol-3-phosphate acyltransferase PlsY
MIDDPKGFFTALLDISFTSYITTKLVKLIYIVCLVLIGIGGLAALVTFFSCGVGAGILGLLMTPIIMLLEIMAVRVWLEMIMVVFRIAEDVNKIARSKE